MTMRSFTVEGFWSIIKRGVVSTFHKMRRKYMPLYVAEFQFRYNNRTNAELIMFGMPSHWPMTFNSAYWSGARWVTTI